MKIKRPKINFKDRRGSIIDIIIKDKINYVTLISSAKGALRANHYHKKTIQMVYIVEGKMMIFSQMPGKPIKKAIINKGDLAITFPMESHATKALEKTIFIVFTKGVRGGKDYEKDTYRLKIPISN